MHKFYYFLFVLLLIYNNARAQKTWDGGGADNNFSTANNWDDNLAPIGGSGETYTFNATSTKSCNFDVAVDCNELQVLSGYTGIITMGTFAVNVNISLVINDGTVNATSTNLSMDGAGSFVLGAGGTFNHNSGSFDVYSAASQVFTFSGNIILNDLTFQTNGPTNLSRTIDFGSSLTANNFIMNSTGAKIYAFQGTIHIKNSLDMGNSSHASNSVLNNGNFIFDGSSADLTGSSSAGANKAYLPNIEINTTGTYTINNSLNVRGNWTGTQGTLTAGSSIVNIYNSTATISGVAAAFDNLTIQAGAVLSLPSGAEVKIARDLVNNGSISTSATALLAFNGGTTGQTISGTAFSVGSIRAYSGSRNVTLSTAITILDSLKVESNVTFASGGNLTLQATSALKGRLAELGSGGSVTGNVNVETFVPGPNAGWANWCTNGVMGQTIGDWDGQIPMTCDGCNYGPGSIPTGDFYSIQGWDETANDYDTTITVNTPLNPGQGFWVFVGADLTNAPDYTIVNTGSLVQGDQNIPITNNSFVGDNFIANPFACPISWDKILTSNSTHTLTDLLSTNIYVYNADIPATTFYSPGSGSSHGLGITGNIPGGQGFYVEDNSGFTMVIHEADKVNANTVATSLLKTTSSTGSTKFRLRVNGFSGEYDETLLHFNTNATTGFDKFYDARKKFQTPGYPGYPGPYSLYTTVSTRINSIDYAINAVPELNQPATIPVLVRVMATGFYTISAIDFVNFSSCLVLVDKLNGVYHDLMDTPYICHISDTTAAPRFELIVCESGNTTPVGIKEFKASSSSIFILQDSNGAVVKTKFEKETKATISAFNIMGQQIMKEIQISGTETTTHLNLESSQQIVFIKVTTDKECLTKKLVTR